MNDYKLALYAVGGPSVGYGHIMRTFAVAEAAVRMKVRVLVVLYGEPPPLQWPCPVLYSTGPEVTMYGKVNVFDGPSGWDLDVPAGFKAWGFVDQWPKAALVASAWRLGGLIYPHFGAVPIPGIATLAGEQWMPLRRELRTLSYSPHSVVTLTYAVPDSVLVSLVGAPRIDLGRYLWEDSVSYISRANLVICPPSTIAYEAMSAGRPVQLYCDPAGPLQRVGEAMVAAHVATWWNDRHAIGCEDGDVPPLQPSRIDTYGGDRLLEAIL